MKRTIGLMATVTIGLLSLWHGSAAAAVEEWATGLWDTSTVPAIPNWPDGSAGTTGVELGTSFESSTEVWVVGVRFYKGDLNTGEHQGSLWLPDGTLVASGTFTNETPEGWQDLLFDDPVLTVPGQTYIASYFSPTANYSAENHYFTTSLTVGPITAHGGANGVYRYSSTSVYPEFSYLSSTYWVTPLWTSSQPPEVDAGPAAVGIEGEAITITGTATDPDGDPLALSWAVVSGPDDGGTCTFADPAALATSITCDDDGEVVVSLTADDGINAPASDTTTVTVSNAAPTLALTVTDAATGLPALAPIQVGGTVEVDAAVSDQGANDSLSCTIAWGDGATDAVAATGGACASAHAYPDPGVYTIVTTVTDDDGATAAAEAMVVVYDPSGGFVTGGGWIDSPAGAYAPDPEATGRANFGFVSKYKKGTTVPTGNTTFRFRNGSFSFKSDSYDWLVVTGSDFAKFKGTGSANGVGGHQFQIWAGDGSPDTFRLKVWTVAADGSEVVVYDNGTTTLGGGNITVHTPKRK